MTASQNQNGAAIPNGPGAAAILAGGIGCGVMGLMAFSADASGALGKAMNFYNPTGSLSGVTTVTIIVWLVVWFLLGRAWANKTIDIGKVNLVSFALLAVGFLLTFPPFMDLLQGK
jgi:hypothetical protein